MESDEVLMVQGMVQSRVAFGLVRGHIKSEVGFIGCIRMGQVV
jgi:hypothetical protein